MITYLIGAGIGYVISELIHEEKAKEVKPVQSPQTTPVENPPTSDPQLEENNEPEEKEVKFIAKSRGKKPN